MDRQRTRVLWIAVVQVFVLYTVGSIHPVDPILWYPLVGAIGIYWMILLLVKWFRREQLFERILRCWLIINLFCIVAVYFSLKEFASKQFLHRQVGGLPDPEFRDESEK